MGIFTLLLNRTVTDKNMTDHTLFNLCLSSCTDYIYIPNYLWLFCCIFFPLQRQFSKIFSLSRRCPLWHSGSSTYLHVHFSDCAILGFWLTYRLKTNPYNIMNRVFTLIIPINHSYLYCEIRVKMSSQYICQVFIAAADNKS